MRFGYLHLIIKGQESQWAAEASECAGEQGQEKFWAYHDKLFAAKAGDKKYPFNKENLKRFAEELGLETKKFTDCLDTAKYKSVVEIDTQAAQIMNVQSTPTFLINGKLLVGAQSFEVFQEVFNGLLK